MRVRIEPARGVGRTDDFRPFASKIKQGVLAEPGTCIQAADGSAL